MRSSNPTVLLFAVILTIFNAFASDEVHPLQVRMDKAASEFKAMTANVTWVTHTDVLNEDSTETGAVKMKKMQAGEVQGLVEFMKPDQKWVHLEKPSLQIYYPKTKIREVWDLGEQADQLYQFVMIGFGTSGTALAKDYDMKVLGTDTPKGQSNPAIHLQLKPKAAKVREYVTMLELWIPEQGDPYPVEEKVSEPSGNYRLVIYSDLKINPPLQADALQLKLPAGVRTEYRGK
jgi:hypothetical protein